MEDATITMDLSGVEVPEDENRQDAIVTDLHDWLKDAVDELDVEGVEMEEPYLRVDLITEDHHTGAADWV